MKNPENFKSWKLGTKGKIGLAVAGTGLAVYGVNRYMKNKRNKYT